MRLHEIDFSSFDRGTLPTTLTQWFKQNDMTPESEDVMLKFTSQLNYQAPKDVVGYRGIRFTDKSIDLLVKVLEGKPVNIKSDRRITSWSHKPDVAWGFMVKHAFGITVQKVIPKGDILLDTADQELQTEYDKWRYGGAKQRLVTYRLGLPGEDEIIAVRRPLEGLILGRDITAFYIYLEAVREHLDTIVPLLEKILVPKMVNKLQRKLTAIEKGAARFSHLFINGEKDLL